MMTPPLVPAPRAATRRPHRAQGPIGTPYEGGTFHVALSIPEQYPLTPPIAKFVTKARGS